MLVENELGLDDGRYLPMSGFRGWSSEVAIE